MADSQRKFEFHELLPCQVRGPEAWLRLQPQIMSAASRTVRILLE